MGREIRGSELIDQLLQDLPGMTQLPGRAGLLSLCFTLIMTTMSFSRLR